MNELSKRMVELFKQGISEKEKQKQRRLLKENYNWDRIAIETFEVYRSVVNPA